MSVPPLFDAATREVLRDVNNSVTEWHSEVTLESVMRDANGDIIRDRYGNEQYEPPTTIKVMLAFRQEAARTTDGVDVTSRAVIRLSFPCPVVTVDDRITLPDGETPRIIEVRRDMAADPYVATRILMQ